jgi:DNA primase catalytic core
MKERLVNLEKISMALRPFLEQYLSEHGIDTSKNFSCINPKHTDKKPSMTCKQYSENAFCWGCGCTADIFAAAHYLEDKPIKGYKFIEENVLYLAKKFGVQIELEDLTPEEIYEYKTYSAYALAAKLIADPSIGNYSLADKEIARREWKKDNMEEWGIGTVNYKEYKEKMQAAGYDAAFLAGVDLDRSNLFNNRNLLFVVNDDFGRPVGFSAKNLKYNKKDDSCGPKYINTRGTGLECAIFKKGERLYGFDVARRQGGYLFIFEGQADVISARHAGHKNCCCTLGTALTDHHINLLKRHGIFNLILVFDGDEAGELAVQKAIDDKLAKEKDFRVKLCQMPAGMDPDEMFRQKGGEAEFVRLKKWTAFEWRMMKFLGDSNDLEEDADKKREIANKMTQLIVSEKSHISQEEMARQVAKITGYDLTTIMSEVKRLRDEKSADVQAKKRAAIEALVSEVRYNPDEAEMALVQAKSAIDEINKSIQDENTSTSNVSIVLSQKEADEAKTGEFAGFFMKPYGLGGIAARLDDDWKTDNLVFIGGSEQAGKCIKIGTRIPLPNGTYKNIESVVKEKEPYVLGMEKNKQIIPMPVYDWIDSGKLNCFKVTTKHGISTKPSETHPYYTLNGWKEVKDLKVGDKIAIVRNYNCFNSLQSPISKEEAILLGGFLSEGSITESAVICNTDQKFITKFKQAARELWPEIEFTQKDPVSIYIKDPTQKNNRATEWLKEYNLLGRTAHSKFIPDKIFQCSPKRIGTFLGMFWAGDGWVHFNPDNKYKCEVGLTLCNYKMLKQIRSLLLRFSIKTKISYRKVKLESKEFDAYTISIKDIENIKKFYNHIKIPLKYKQDNLKAILDSNKGAIGSYNDNFPTELWDRIKEKAIAKGWSFNHLMLLIGEDKNRFSYDKSKDRFKEVAAWRPTANSRKHKGQEWLQITPRKLRLIGNLLQDKFLIDLANGDIYFDEITEIIAIGKHQCYDLAVDHPDHNFIAEDTVVHNTTLCTQMAYEIADDPRNNAMCIYHSIDDAARYPLYKWVCNATADTKLALNHVSNPNYWSKQEGYEFVKDLREEGYRKILKLIKDDRLVLKDSSDGQSITYTESLIKFYKDKYPDRNIVLFLDNFHKLPDFPEMKTNDRNKRMCNMLKNMTTQHHVTVISTVEYRKLAKDEKPSNLVIAESRAFQYDSTVLIHLHNDMHHKGADQSVLVHQNENGDILPRIWVKFGKNKVSGYEGREFVDLFGYAGQVRAVELDIAIQEQKDRVQFLKENKPNDF